MRYLLFDTAINGYYTLTLLQKEFPDFRPLMPAEEKISDDVAPFIFQVDNQKLAALKENVHASFQKVLYLESDQPILAIADFYGRLVVQEVKGRPFYFRFWAANVFKKYIRTCDTDQLKNFFGPVQQFLCEDEDPATILSFSLQSGKLVVSKTSAEPAHVVNTEVKTSLTQPPVANGSTIPENNTAEQEVKKPPRRFFY